MKQLAWQLSNAEIMKIADYWLLRKFLFLLRLASFPP